MSACRYVEEIGLAAILAAERLAGVTPEVNLSKHVTRMSLPSANKALKAKKYKQGCFETQKRHHQKSKTGVSVAPQKDLCPPKI